MANNINSLFIPFPLQVQYSRGATSDAGNFGTTLRSMPTICPVWHASSLIGINKRTNKNSALQQGRPLHESPFSRLPAFFGHVFPCRRVQLACTGLSGLHDGAMDHPVCLQSPR